MAAVNIMMGLKIGLILYFLLLLSNFATTYKDSKDNQDMKMMRGISVCIIMACMLVSGFLNANAQEPDKQPDIYERAEMEADRLQKILDLEDWQVFYVDSTLKHDYPAMMAECEKLQASRVMNSSIYIAVQDKWMEKIDMTYKKIFTEAQWAAYLKSGAQRAQKAREKRKAAVAKKK
jgi:hypothetical protein